MSLFKRLAAETAIYGISSIVGRALYFLLTPLYTNILDRSVYSETIELFAYTALVMVLFTYRMETAFFRFGSKEEERKKAFDTGALSLLISSSVFSLILLVLHQPIAVVLGYAAHSEYIAILSLIILFDALSEIPYAKLRLEKKAMKFAKIRLINITTNIAFNLFFLLGCPYILGNETLSQLHPLISSIYNPEWAIGYIFISNLIASFVQFLLLLPQYKGISFHIDKAMWRKMFFYAAPLVIASLAGVINEVFDKALLKWRLPFDMETNKSLLGEYGAVYKLTIIISLFSQAFRYSAEPFFFRNSDRKDSKQIYSDVTRYFTLFSLLGFIVIACYIDLFKFLIGSEYWGALHIVPILLMANVFLGIYYNVSIWYRLTDQTSYGLYIGVFGAVLTIVLNWIWIPQWGYLGSAWATFFCYFLMTVLCYLIGRKYYNIPYPMLRLTSYLLLSVGMVYFSNIVRNMDLHLIHQLFVQTAIVVSFVIVCIFSERKHIKKVLELN